LPGLNYLFALAGLFVDSPLLLAWPSSPNTPAESLSFVGTQRPTTASSGSFNKEDGENGEGGIHRLALIISSLSLVSL